LLEADVYLRNPTGYERWTSRDGVQWSPRFSQPVDLVVHDTTFGLVAIDPDRVYVSIDAGASWGRAPVPTEFRRLLDQGANIVTSGAFDDFILIRADTEDGTRRFLIGRFQNDN
jgi:hypothetical protein